jgi:hypothetical protein
MSCTAASVSVMMDTLAAANPNDLLPQFDFDTRLLPRYVAKLHLQKILSIKYPLKKNEHHDNKKNR